MTPPPHTLSPAWPLPAVPPLAGALSSFIMPCMGSAARSPVALAALIMTMEPTTKLRAATMACSASNKRRRRSRRHALPLADAIFFEGAGVQQTRLSCPIHAMQSAVHKLDMLCAKFSGGHADNVSFLRLVAHDPHHKHV